MVELPLLRNAGSESGDEGAGGAGGRPAARDPQTEILRGVSVLVVDDEPDALALVRTVLEMRGARVTAVGSAGAAWGALEGAWPDLLLCDVGMPDEDGYDFIRRLRELEGGRALPSIALTAYAGESDRAQALEAGFQLHVPKPVEPSALVSLIADLTGRR
jgi:CheY-like chemotaxis protein